MILLDGPMGTELAVRGVETPAPTWSAAALDTAPQVVRAIHVEYMKAGAQVHRTNTFRAQPRLFPERYGALVETAVRLAREAVAEAGASTNERPRVAGSMAPIADCYRPDLSPPKDEARALHRTLAVALADAGVDLLVCETFPHAVEVCVAVEEAARTGLETWAALTAGPDGSLMTPEAMERAARDCISAGAAAVLVCCTGASLTHAYVDRLARIDVRFGAYANAGAAEDALGWGADPSVAARRYADLAERWLERGASIVGSCCGTGPAHIAELHRRHAPS